MKVTTKGQVTIPQHIREKMAITPSSEVDFVEEGDRVYVVRRKERTTANRTFAKLRGVATVKMTTEEIMSLTRANS